MSKNGQSNSEESGANDPEDPDFVPDQWDDAEQFPWDCDLGVPW